MKKRNWLMTIAFAVLSLTIISTAVIGSTYAKFTSNVSGNGGVKAAGFLIGAGTGSDDVALTAETEVTVPGGVAESSIEFTYYSQVNTEFSTAIGNGYTLAGVGALADWDAVKTGFGAWVALNFNRLGFASEAAAAGLKVDDAYVTPTNMTDLFTVSFNAGSEDDIAAENLPTAFAEAVRAAGDAASIFATEDGKADLTGAQVDAMKSSATAALQISALTVKVTWNSSWGSATQAQVDAFDTYIGDIVATKTITTSTGENPTTVWSGLQVKVYVKASQITA